MTDNGILPDGHSVAYLQSLQDEKPFQPQEVGMWNRLTGLALTAPVRAANNLIGGVNNIAGGINSLLFNDPERSNADNAPIAQSDLPIPQADSTSGQIANFVGAGLLPAALELAAVGKVTSPFLPAGEGVGAQVARSAINNAVGFGTLGASEDATTGLEQTGEGAALGLAHALPLWARIPASVGLGLASKAFADRNNPQPIGQFLGHDWTPGDVSGVLQAGFGIFGGQAKLPKKAPLPDHFQYGTPGTELALAPQPEVPRDYGQIIQPIPTEGGIGPNGVVYGAPSSTPPAPTFPDIMGYRGPDEPTVPLLPIGRADNPFVQLTDFGQPQTIDQLLNRKVPVTSQGEILPGIPMPGPAATEAAQTPIGLQALQSNEGRMQIVKQLFDPSEAEWLRNTLHVDVGAPEVQQASMQLMLALSTREVRQSARAQQIAFAKFFDQVFHRPDVGAFQSEMGQEAWNQITQLSPAEQEAHAALPPEIQDAVKVPPSSPLSPGEQEILQQLQSQRDAQNLSKAAADATVQVDTARATDPTGTLAQSLSDIESQIHAEEGASKIGAGDPENLDHLYNVRDALRSKLSEGGFTNQDLVNHIAGVTARGGIGYVAGSLTAKQLGDDYDPVLSGLLGAGIGIGLPYAKNLVALMQRIKQRAYSIPESPLQSGPRFRSTVDSAQTRLSNEDLMKLTPKEQVKQVWAGPEEARVEAEREAARRGKMSSVPEWMRSQGGGVANPFSVRAGLPEGLKTDVKDDAGGVTISLHQGKYIDPANRVGQLSAYIEDGQLKIQGANLDEAFQNKKLGLYMYDKLADIAKAKKLQLVSDNMLSSDADRVYQALEKRGYTIEKNPAAVENFNPQKGDPKWVTTNGHPVYDITPPKDLQPLQSDGGMKSGGKEAGSLFPGLGAAMARSAVTSLIGGAIGGQSDQLGESSGFITGALIGGLAGAFGPAMGRKLLASMSKQKLPSPSIGPKGGLSDLIKTFSLKMEEAGGGEFVGTSHFMNRFVRTLENRFDFRMPELVKETLLQAKGAAAVLMDQIDKSVLKISLRFSPTDEVKNLTNDYFDGKFAGGSNEYLQRLQSAINTDPNVQAYANFAVTARTAVDGLQRMIAEGVGDPKMKKIINDSLGSYLTRSYRLFTDSRYVPSEIQTQRLAEEMSKLKHTSGPNIGKPLMGTTDAADIASGLRGYVREMKATKGVYVAASPTGEAINQAVLRERVNLSPTWKDFLGEITDPTERVYQTIFRLRPMAEASRYFERIANITVDGLPQVFSNASDHKAFETSLLQRLQSVGADSAEGIKTRTQLESLKSYQYVEDESRYGSLARKLVNRHVWDTLKTYDSMMDMHSHPWLRTIGQTHTMIKLARTAFNPITVIRNIMTVPSFMMIAKVAPSDMVRAYQILNNVDNPMWKEILEQGIGNVDQVKTEFFKEFENITQSKYNFGTLDGTNMGMGVLDLDLAERVARRGFRKVMDFYRLPDNLVRMGAYLAAKDRISAEMGLDLQHPTVLQKATEFTNRYTMNYDSIVPAIKGLRQVPLFNLFLSYASEMARLGKNLAEDVITGDQGNIAHHGRMFAMIPLGAIAALPEMIQSSAENDLSEKDRADWEKAKKLMPDYARTRYKFNITRDSSTGMFHYQDFTPMIPSDAWNQTTKAILNQDWAALGQVNPLIGWNNTPALNIVISQATGKDLQSQRPFRTTTTAEMLGDRATTALKEIVPPNFPSIGSESRNFRLAYTTTDTGEQGVTDLRTGKRLTPADFWGVYVGPLGGNSALPGIRGQSTSLQVLQTKAANAAKQDVANEIAYMNDVIKSNANKELKQQAIDRATVALKLIQERYAEQVGAK